MKIMKTMKDMKEGMKEASDPTAKPERHPFMSFIRFMPFM
jgi:hypothetical protein